MATNSNPVYNRERFDEAHDVIVKTWTTPGPFRWEGKHFQYRIINPWMMPIQKPHPAIWIPGVASPESIIWAARHRYPYVALAPSIELLRGIYDLYGKTAEEEGYTATPDNRGYAIRVACADTDEEAYELGRNWYWQLGTSFGIAPRHWQAPPGYLTRAAQQGARTAGEERHPAGERHPRRPRAGLRTGPRDLSDRHRQPRHRDEEA